VRNQPFVKCTSQLLLLEVQISKGKIDASKTIGNLAKNKTDPK